MRKHREGAKRCDMSQKKRLCELYECKPPKYKAPKKYKAPPRVLEILPKYNAPPVLPEKRRNNFWVLKSEKLVKRIKFC